MAAKAIVSTPTRASVRAIKTTSEYLKNALTASHLDVGGNCNRIGSGSFWTFAGGNDLSCLSVDT